MPILYYIKGKKNIVFKKEKKLHKIISKRTSFFFFFLIRVWKSRSTQDKSCEPVIINQRGNVVNLLLLRRDYKRRKRMKHNSMATTYLTKQFYNYRRTEPNELNI